MALIDFGEGLFFLVCVERSVGLKKGLEERLGRKGIESDDDKHDSIVALMVLRPALELLLYVQT